MKHVSTNLSKLTMGVLALVATLGSAQAATLASASASLSNIKITLVDLDPNDGIAPSVSFGTGFLSLFNDQAPPDQGYTIAHTGTLFGSTASDSSGGLSYNLSPTAITLNASADSSQFGQATLSEYGSYYSASASNGISLTAVSPADVNNYYQVGQFTLGANTGLFITGTASVNATAASASAVAAAASGSFDATVVDVSQVFGSAYAFASISAILTSTDVLSPQWYSYDAPNAIVSKIQREVGAYGNEDAPSEDSRSFVLSFANVSSESVEGSLGFTMRAGVNAYANALSLSQPEVPTIPEPSTYLLMGLGLAGIGLACSRQRARQAAEA